MPPDQYVSYQDKRYSPAVRLWSLLVQCTIAPGHRSGPATFRDQPLGLNGAAKILKLDLRNVQTAWRELKRENRVRRDHQGQIWIAGDFQLDQREGEEKGGEEKAGDVCTNVLDSLFSKSVASEIKKLPERLREPFIKRELQARENMNSDIADFVAAIRFYYDQEQNSRFFEVGVKIKRQNHRPPKGKEKEKADRDQRVFRLLPTVETFVQTSHKDDIVQLPEADDTTGLHQAASLLHSENRERFENKAATTAIPESQQQQFDPSLFPLTDAAITRHFPACNSEYRGRIVRAALALNDTRINDESIASAVLVATEKNQRSAALYLETVPNVISAWLRDAERRKTA